MKIHEQLATWMVIFALSVLTSPVSAIGQEQPEKNDYSWLNGRWAGEHTSGRLEMELRVKVRDITGQGTTYGGREGALHSTVTGNAEGNNITLDVYPPAKKATRYQCRATEDKALECSAKKGSFHTIFSRIR